MKRWPVSLNAARGRVPLELGAGRRVVRLARCALTVVVWSLVMAGTTSAGLARPRPEQPESEQSGSAQGFPALAPPEGRGSAVRISARTDRTECSTVDQIVLTIEVGVPSDSALVSSRGVGGEGSPGDVDRVVLTPELRAGQELGDFTIADARRAPPALENGQVTVRWMVTLEPFLPGNAMIPAIRASVGGSTATSEPIRIAVDSVLETGGAFAPGELRQPLDRVPSLAASGGVGWILPALAGVGVGALGVLGLAAARPTAARRARRAFASLQRRAARAVEIARTGDAGAKSAAAQDALGALSDGLVLAMGPGVRAATAAELPGVLERATAGASPPLPQDQLEVFRGALDWLDRRRFAGERSPPPELPDVPRILGALGSRVVAQTKRPGAMA